MLSPSQIQAAIEAGTDPDEILRLYLSEKYKIELPKQQQPGTVQAPRLR